MIMIGKSGAKYKVVLKAYGNPDHGQNPREMVCESATVYADTADELSVAVRNWIVKNNLGCGNFAAAKVYSNEPGHKKEVVGNIYFNGKFKDGK